MNPTTTQIPTFASVREDAIWAAVNARRGSHAANAAVEEYRDQMQNTELRGYAIAMACLMHSLGCGLIMMSEAEECDRWLKRRAVDDGKVANG